MTYLINRISVCLALCICRKLSVCSNIGSRHYLIELISVKIVKGRGYNYSIVTQYKFILSKSKGYVIKLTRYINGMYMANAVTIKEVVTATKVGLFHTLQ